MRFKKGFSVSIGVHDMVVGLFAAVVHLSCKLGRDALKEISTAPDRRKLGNSVGCYPSSSPLPLMKTHGRPRYRDVFGGTARVLGTWGCSSDPRRCEVSNYSAPLLPIMYDERGTGALIILTIRIPGHQNLPLCCNTVTPPLPSCLFGRLELYRDQNER